MRRDALLNAILFSLLCFLSEAVYLLPGRIVVDRNLAQRASVLVQLLWIAVLLICFQKIYGFELCAIRYPYSVKKSVIQSSILLLLPIWNLLTIRNCAIVLQIHTTQVLLVIIWALIEELLFRGMLPAAYCYCSDANWTVCALLSATVFALFHITNYNTGVSIGAFLVQMLSAFGIGFCFAALRKTSGSIFPGVVIHSLMNLSAMPLDNIPTEKNYIIPWIIISVFCMVYGLFLLREKRD